MVNNMKEFKIINDDNNGLLIAWEKSSLITKYVILGKDNLFNDTIICETTDNKIHFNSDELKGIIAISVEYIFYDEDTSKEIVIDRTIPYIRKLNGYKMVYVSSTYSPYGITLSYAANIIYNKYFIYEKIDGKYIKILETEDFQVTSNKFKEGSTYYVEGYSLEEDGSFKLKCKSFEYVCEPKIEIPNFTKPKVSIIIPVYNGARFISRAIDSILLSSLKEKEIILINDGSTDNSKQLLDWYARRYPSIIKVINKNNEGTPKARYLGLDYVTADYTYYMDQDDFVHPLMLEKMYNCITEEEADFVMNKVVVEYGFDNTTLYFNQIDDKTNPKRCIVKDYADFIMSKHNGSTESFYLVTLWQHMTKTQLYREHKMPDFAKYEDVAYVRSLFSYGKKFAFQMDSYYVWDRRLQNTIGTSSTRSNEYYSGEEKIKMYIDAIFYFLNDYNKDNLDYLIYDTLYDIQRYCAVTINAVYNDNCHYNRDNLYMEYAYKYLKNIDVSKNKLLLNDSNLLKTYNGIMAIMENAIKEGEKAKES